MNTPCLYSKPSAAKDAEEIIILKLNVKDLSEIPAHAKKGIKIHPVEETEQVIETALVPGPKKKGGGAGKENAGENGEESLSTMDSAVPVRSSPHSKNAAYYAPQMNIQI